MQYFFAVVLAVTLCVFSAPVFGQSAYEPGYIIRAGGERVEGFIQNREWVSSPTEIRFRRSLDAEPTTYTYRELDEFKVGDHHFRRFTVRADDTPVGWSRNIAPEDRVWIQREGLLRVLAEGPLTIYYLRHRGEYFFADINGELVELRRHSFYASVRGETRTIVVDEFRDILVQRTMDCPEALRTVGDVDLTRRDLESYSSRYNACVAPERFAFVDKRYPLRIRPGLALGLGYNTSYNKASSYRAVQQLLSFDVPSTQRMRFGIAGLIELPGLHNRRAVELRIVADRFQWSTRDHATLWWCHSGTQLFPCPPSLPEGRYITMLNTSEHTAIDLQFAAHARYAFSDRAFRPFGAIGMTVSLPVHSSIRGDVTERFISLDYQESWEENVRHQMTSSRHAVFGPSMSVGLTYRGAQLEVNGQFLGQDLDPNRGFSLVNFMLSYYL